MRPESILPRGTKFIYKDHIERKIIEVDLESCKGCEVFIFNKRIEKRHKVKKDDDKKTLAERFKTFIYK